MYDNLSVICNSSDLKRKKGVTSVSFSIRKISIRKYKAQKYYLKVKSLYKLMVEGTPSVKI